jgi:uncharacterized protein (TIGR00255 family)
MTGFGRASAGVENGSIQIEIKSLNSKFLDLGLRLPSIFSEKELEVRTIIQDKLERGKISVSIEYRTTLPEQIPQRYNEALFTAHYAELKKLADRVMAPYDNIFEMALRSPDVAIEQDMKASASVQEKLIQALSTAVAECNKFRLDEGTALAGKLETYITAIRSSLDKVEKLDPVRIDKIRTRIKKNVTDFFGEEGFDANRLEQEIIFYIEKLDIHEERVRLRTHLSYFSEVMKDSQSSGKKLAFIVQEIGREINTIGSKANDAEMQREVVMMKEELEKIKEQLSNVL